MATFRVPPEENSTPDRCGVLNSVQHSRPTEFLSNETARRKAVSVSCASQKHSARTKKTSTCFQTRDPFNPQVQQTPLGRTKKWRIRNSRDQHMSRRPLHRDEHAKRLWCFQSESQTKNGGTNWALVVMKRKNSRECGYQCLHRRATTAQRVENDAVMDASVLDHSIQSRRYRAEVFVKGFVVYYRTTGAMKAPKLHVADTRAALQTP